MYLARVFLVASRRTVKRKAENKKMGLLIRGFI